MREEILGKKVESIDIDNDIIFSIGGELIFGKIIKDLGCEDYFKKVKIRKLEKRLNDSIKFKKSDLKLSPYAKFIDLETKSLRGDNCQIIYTINEEKIKLDEKLDGIKGYITNDFTLSHNETISHYTNLYNIEKAFRISKTDLKIRPVYHRLENRIKAHILISFCICCL